MLLACLTARLSGCSSAFPLACLAVRLSFCSPVRLIVRLSDCSHACLAACCLQCTTFAYVPCCLHRCCCSPAFLLSARLPIAPLAFWLAAWLADRLPCCSPGWLLACLLAVRLSGFLPDCSSVLRFGCLLVWLLACLAARLSGCSAGWQATPDENKAALIVWEVFRVIIV